MPVHRSLRATITALVVFLAANLLADEPPGVDRSTGDSGQQPASEPPADDKGIDYWLGQLDSNQFAQRQAASTRLLAYGDDAVQPLVELTQRGKLEVTNRVVQILRALAAEQSPDDDGGAWGALNRLVDRGAGAASMAARSAMGELKRQREQRALSELSAAGIDVDFREFVIQSRPVNQASQNELVVWIDKSWRGDPAVLGWLRWVRGVQFALVEGTAVRRDVLQHVVKMPDLRSIVLRLAELQDDIFEPLGELKRIDHLELRYIPLTLEHVDQLLELPLRHSLSLVGTELPLEGAQRLREEKQELALHYKEGGFLGVISHSATRCEIGQVTAGGAAASAGLRPGDLIVQIDEQAIQTFEDLQLKIGSHRPGDELEITYDRQGEVDTVTVTLGRLDD